MSEAIAREKVKALGQVITPQEVAEFLADWAIRTPKDTILEPSFGDGVFLRASIKRLLNLGASLDEIPHLIYGVEFDPEMFELTKTQLKKEFDVIPTLINADFFEIDPDNGQRQLAFQPVQHRKLPKVDVVIGNPPYIRYQLFQGELRKKALAISEHEGVKLTELTASWVPFVIHAKRFLKKDGRIALVLPTKLLHVGYAKHFRKWLLREFASIIIITFEERIFPGILEDALLLLGERTGENQVKFLEVRNERELRDRSRIRSILESQISFNPSPNEKWTKYLLPANLMNELQEILEMHKRNLFQLGDIGFVTIGVVTGDNQFFTLSEREARQWGIEEKYLVPVITKAEDLQGLRLTNEDWALLKKLGRKCYLLYVTDPENALESGVRKYLEQKGEELKVRERYKVRVRKRWYEIPGVRFPDLFLSYMAHDVPKIVVNKVNINGKTATSTNTIHHIFLREPVNPLAVATAFYNSLTLASAELSGRFYGGGVLKLEPKEAEKVLIPKIHSVDELLNVSDKVDRLLRKKKVFDAVELVNEIVLEGQIGLSRKEIEVLTEIWQHLRQNRMKKNKG